MNYRYLLPLTLFVLLSACTMTGENVNLVATVAPRPLIYERELPTGILQPLDNPPTVSVSEAADTISPNAIVMGVEMNGEARAYPLGMMLRYQLANDTVGGEPIAITFCAACNTGLVFSRQVGEQALLFDISGLLLDNALVLVDRSTGSLWSQVRLEAVEGSLAGTRLALQASNQMTWSEWAKTYPQTTLVLDPRAPKRPTTTTFEMAGLPDPDAPTSDSMRGYIVGIATDENAVAYALARIRAEGMIQHEAEGQSPLLLMALDETGMIIVWERTVDGRVLTFQGDRERLTDVETGTRWDARTGDAVEGTLQGNRLMPVNIWITDWRGWFDLYPNTVLYQ